MIVGDRQASLSITRNCGFSTEWNRMVQPGAKNKKHPVSIRSVCRNGLLIKEDAGEDYFKLIERP